MYVKEFVGVMSIMQEDLILLHGVIISLQIRLYFHNIFYLFLRI